MTSIPDIALSVRQPSAWALLHGGKDIENRTAFSVKAGGMKPARIALHAAKGMTQAEYEYAAYKFADIGCVVPRPDDLARGAIIGVIEVIAIVHREETGSPWMSRRSPDMRGLVVADPMAIQPIPADGARGYFKWKAGGEVCQPAAWMRRWNHPSGDDRTTDLFADQAPAYRAPPKRPWG
ncbi:MAG: hypothetical protein QNI84_03500 [Henriciella sp.]|nr:hypothetical protein [Henriciella sp.]